MAYSDSPYAGSAYGADALSVGAPPGQTLPPPVPGGTTVYYYSAENGFYPFAYGGFAGARPKIPSAPGGVVVLPQSETGVVEVHGWWPDARYLHFVRLHDDGSRHPVRGGYGVEVEGVTRTNVVTNPSLEVGLNGFVPGLGSPTLNRIQSGVTYGFYALRATNASAGQSGVTVPTATMSSPLTATVAADVRLSARPTALRFEISWSDSGGGALAATNVSFTADQINAAVNQWSRLTAVVAPPFGAVTPTFKVVADGMPAAGMLDLDALLLEAGTYDGSYYDGSSLGARWVGTADLSASQLAPVMVVSDPDCPLDAPVRYLVANPAIAGGSVTSPTVELSSVGRFCWLTHPTRNDPVKCDLQAVPVLERGVDQGIFYPIGRSRALVVSAARQAPSAELIFNAVSFAERDLLLDLMADGAPLLLRAPARYGYGYGTWWSMGTVTEDREGRPAFLDAMILTAEAVEVDPPSPYVVA